MDKTKRKKQTYNEDAISELKKKYGFTRDYIVKSIRGDRNGTLPLQIAEEYKIAARAAKKAVQSKI